MAMVGDARAPGLTIIVPTFNEAPNVAELVNRLNDAIGADVCLGAHQTEVIFVDDSTDNTPGAIAAAAAWSAVPVRCIHRGANRGNSQGSSHSGDRSGGLGTAVLEGIRAARYDLCLIMDGDLQHPPERIAAMYARMQHSSDVDVVVASRYAGGGNASGLASWLRRAVSSGSTLMLKAMFPIRLHDCSDPMTGYFLIDRTRIELDELRPRGFKILLEILARQRLTVAEVPFEFAPRHAGESKASLRQGLHFLSQLLQLRFGRMSGFALIGAIGAAVNIAIVWWLSRTGVGVLPATLIAAEVTIVGNFLAQDHFVFGDLRRHTRGFWGRFWRSFAFNNVEGLIRIALVVWVVQQGWASATVATAVFLALAFVIRYVFHALVVYAPTRR